MRCLRQLGHQAVDSSTLVLQNRAWWARPTHRDVTSAEPAAEVLKASIVRNAIIIHEGALREGDCPSGALTAGGRDRWSTATFPILFRAFARTAADGVSAFVVLNVPVPTAANGHLLKVFQVTAAIAEVPDAQGRHERSNLGAAALRLIRRAAVLGHASRGARVAARIRNR